MRRTHAVLPIAAALSLLLCTDRPCLASPSCAADVNNSGSVTVQDLFDFLAAWFRKCLPPLSPTCNGITADFNNNVAVTVQDLFDFLAAWFARCPAVLVVSVSPQSGGLGTVITITANPAVAPYVFGPTTTATWNGQYFPAGGGSSAPFTITFSAADVRELNSSQAQIVLGAGTGNVPVSVASLGAGVLHGTLSVTFGPGATATTMLDFTPVPGAGTFKLIVYPSGTSGIDPPQLGIEPSDLILYRLSQLPNSSTPTAGQLLAATGAHIAPLIRVARNSTSAVAAPSSVKADVVSYNGSGVEVDRLANLVLFLLADSDPSFLNYAASLTKPLIPIDVAVDKSAYPQFLLITTPADGSIGVVPSATY